MIDINNAIRHIGEKDYHQFLILEENETVGIVEYIFLKSEIDNKEIIYLKNIYIKKEYRGKGIGKKVINELKQFNWCSLSHCSWNT